MVEVGNPQTVTLEEILSDASLVLLLLREQDVSLALAVPVDEVYASSVQLPADLEKGLIL